MPEYMRLILRIKKYQSTSWVENNPARPNALHPIKSGNGNIAIVSRVPA
jgi:hypothetical protein